MVDFRPRPPRAGHDGAVDYLSLRSCCAASRRRDGRRGHATAPGRSTTGWCGRSCSPRSTSSRREGSAALAAAVVRETLLAGGRAYHPLIARDGLGDRVRRAGARSSSEQHGGAVRFEQQLRALAVRRRRGSRRSTSATRQCRLGDGRRRRARGAALDGRSAGAGACATPTEFRAIVNAHFRIEPPPASAADHRRGQRHGRMAVRLPGPAVGHHQRRRPPARHARARSSPQTIWRDVAQIAGIADAAAAVANRARTAGDLRRHAGAGRQAARRARRAGPICSRRRLDRDRPAGDHRRRDPLGPPRGGIDRASADACDRRHRHDDRRSMRDARRAHRGGDATRCSRASSRTATGCSSSKPTPPSRPNTCCCGIISASRSTPSWKRKIAVYLRRIQGAAWRLAAVPRRRVRHERQREGLFRAEDDRRRHRRAAHAARARGDPRRAAARPRATCSPRCCWRCSA